jgi:hypothetical protein
VKLPHAESIEVIGDVSGKAVVRYDDRIQATNLKATDLTRALADCEAAGETSAEVDHLLSLVCALDDVNCSANVSLEDTPGVPSIVACVTAHKESTLILWRGQTAEHLAKKIGQCRKHSVVMALPFPSSPVVEGMIKRYQDSAGFPASPRWLHDRIVDSGTLTDLDEAIRGRRLVVLIAERISYWEIDSVLALTASEGTPVLPVTFAGARAQIGPLIVGGNTSPFYLSRLGLSGNSSPETSAAVRLLSASEGYDGNASDVVAREILKIIEHLPDASCVSVCEVEQDAKINSKTIYPRRSVFDRRLEGSLWSIETLLDVNVASDDKAWDRAAWQLQNGRVVSIESAFRKEVAEIMQASLISNTRWRVYEAMYPYFFFHHHNIYDPEDMSPAMLVSGMIFASSYTVKWASELVGSDCDGTVQQSASWYMPGDHSTPHSDAASRRKLAFVWHLAGSWEATWGGHLVWVGGDKIIPAGFNALHLFDTRKSGRHFVMPVAPNATGRRLCWNGWWTATQEEPDEGIGTDPNDIFERSGAFRFY